MGKRRKRAFATEEEREAHERRVDEDIKRLRDLAEKGWAELERRKASGEPPTR